MQRIGRALGLVLVAFAVLTVSATCSSAGCLIPLLASRSAAPHMACCGDEGAGGGGSPAQAPSSPSPSHCPTCDQPLFNASAVDKTTHAPLAGGPVFFALLPLDSAMVSLPQTRQLTRQPGISPALGPPTLFHLCCALIN